VTDAEIDGSGRVWLRGSTIRDGLAVVTTGLRVLRRHWPTLLALSLAGEAARAFIEDGAVRLSHVNALAGLLVFILVPIATLCALTLMVWTVRPSLPSLSTVLIGGDSGPRRLLDRVGSVLIPFLAVYASYGYLQEDRSEYAYATWQSDPTGPVSLPTRITVGLIVVVIVAIALRAVLNRWTWATSRGWVGIVRAYLEVTWIGVSASLIGPLKDTATGWLTDRRAVHAGATAVGRVEDLGAPVHHVVSWFGTALGSVDTVILVPLAWLAVGAVIYGRSIDDEEAADTRLARAAARRTRRLPRIVRRMLAALERGLTERFGPLINGVRMLLRSGLISMLLFCLLFLVVQTAAVWLFLAERTAIGPRDLMHFWVPVSGPLSVLNDSVQTVALVCLLAGAAERVLDRRASAVRAVFDAPTEPHRMIPAPREPAEELSPSTV
jgi:hypothetical protein